MGIAIYWSWISISYISVMGKKVICIVGQLGSGKGTAARFFVKQGYKFYSLRDRVREDMEKVGLELTRTNMQDFADDLRKRFGLTVFAVKTEKLFLSEGSEKVVLESFRNPAEVTYFKTKYHAKVIGIVADPKKRFAFMAKRGRMGDPKTWEEFLKVDNRDKGIGQAVNGQQTVACLNLADVVVENNGTVEELEQKLGEL